MVSTHGPFGSYALCISAMLLAEPFILVQGKYTYGPYRNGDSWYYDVISRR